MVIKKMPLFRGFGDTILSKLIVSLRSQFLPPNEVVCLEGEIGRHTYLIRKGYLDVRCSLGWTYLYGQVHAVSSVGALSSIAVHKLRQRTLEWPCR